MATIGRSNNASTQSAPRRSYISTYPFPGYFFSYKVQPGVIPTFALGPVDGADTTTCPPGLNLDFKFIRGTRVLYKYLRKDYS